MSNTITVGGNPYPLPTTLDESKALRDKIQHEAEILAVTHWFLRSSKEYNKLIGLQLANLLARRRLDKKKVRPPNKEEFLELYRSAITCFKYFEESDYDISFGDLGGNTGGYISSESEKAALRFLLLEEYEPAFPRK